MTIDLRSDTVTRPSDGMREAMHAAELGDDVYGEDQRMNDFQVQMAELFGKESALFMPSGTMANAVAINVHARAGDSILVEENSHCELYEAGGAAALSGMQFQSLPFEDRLNIQAIQSAVVGDHLQSSPTRIFVGENTHNFAGGLWRGSGEWAEAKTVLGDVIMHCDGARIWNAHIASGEALDQLCLSFDSVSICFSKGLGAPIGSILLGGGEFIERARKIRKRLGGGMRQVGFLAAACEFAVNEQLSDLELDHQRAKQCRDELSGWTGTEVRMNERMTNMVYFKTENGGPGFSERCAKNGLLLHQLPDGWIRLVFHRDLEEHQIPELCAILKRTLKSES
ncbi:beta-eliminating lyase-related protein [Oligoflexaceae bacterium]|nr:beta-eliminating lyase-related protein [Oligoflexaceae bacterium]